MSANQPAPILLYDGLCGFCDGFVQFVLARDGRGDMQFAPLQGTFARGVLARHPALAGVDSLVLVYPTTDGKNEWIAVRSTAAIAIAEYVGGIWAMSSIFRIVPRSIRDWGYDFFAQHRYQWFGRRNACRIPTADVKSRFID